MAGSRTIEEVDHGALGEEAHLNRGYFHRVPDEEDSSLAGIHLGVEEHYFLTAEVHPDLPPLLAAARMVEDRLAFRHGELLRDPTCAEEDVLWGDRRHRNLHGLVAYRHVVDTSNHEAVAGPMIRVPMNVEEGDLLAT